MKRVLSIQSHVVSGYVGNKAAVFPMQLHGWDVDVLNSVQFSNHTGYASFQGERLSGSLLLQLLKGLQDNDLLSADYLLTGYVGSETFLSSILQVWQQLLIQKPHAKYVCDPVLGDQGRFYVPESLVQVYREQVIPQATIVTPNAFELEQLTGCEPISTLEMAQRQCHVLHDMGPSIVFLTSFQPLGQDVMMILASQRTESRTQCWKLECPVLPGSFTGTGDLCAALILVHSANHPNDLATVLEKVVNTVYAVLETTLEYADKDDSTVKARELRLIQSKDVMEHPPKRFRAVLL
ncbi:pyridoxine kinase [Fistulifera solaris]|uniref:pyridoxal kinase n=1 Tax=Fistulifera solaris TaxID=1519565 RepID=A0A1Z5JXV8_FISSO|nr:pyridoxine kinase [Fistulifera solaris]|eukprot:GAX18834.1 pyridoxine kinase [Fistulifera solaris]